MNSNRFRVHNVHSSLFTLHTSFSIDPLKLSELWLFSCFAFCCEYNAYFCPQICNSIYRLLSLLSPSSMVPLHCIYIVESSRRGTRSSKKLFQNSALWYVTTTDRGSNEVAARNIVQAYIAMHLGTAPVFYCNSDCCEHLAHLITLGSMKLVDEELQLQDVRKWRYFSSLAVFSNTVRGLAKSLYHEWCAQHGDLSGQKCVYKLFPRCDSGRWNSTDVTEKRIMACSQEMFEPVLRKVLGQAISKDNCGSADVNVWSDCKGSGGGSQPSKPSVSKTKKSKTGATLVNDLSLEESKEFSAKVGKYRRSTLLCVGDPLWWRLIDVMNAVKQPTVHLSCFLKKSLKRDELEQKGNALTQLVHGKASEIMSEYEKILDSLDLSRTLAKALPARDKCFCRKYK